MPGTWTTACTASCTSPSCTPRCSPWCSASPAWSWSSSCSPTRSTSSSPRPSRWSQDTPSILCPLSTQLHWDLWLQQCPREITDDDIHCKCFTSSYRCIIFKKNNIRLRFCEGHPHHVILSSCHYVTMLCYHVLAMFANISIIYNLHSCYIFSRYGLQGL